MNMKIKIYKEILGWKKKKRKKKKIQKNKK